MDNKSITPSENASSVSSIEDNLRIQENCDIQAPSKSANIKLPMNSTKENNSESVEGLKNQLEVLTNSLAVLSSEKSKMEANFQNDKRQIRSEREEYERVVKNFKEKLKRIQSHAMAEVEHLKYKLIMERHEREKDQNEHAATAKELQKIVHTEQKAREQLEAQMKELKSGMPNKTQNKILEAELDALRNKLKQAEAANNETPSILQALQSEMNLMKKKYKSAIHEEQKRAAAAEQEAKASAAVHESRVAGLEARLAELSEIVGGYDRLRLQDQKAIQSLKEQLIILQDNKKVDVYDNPKHLASKIKELYLHLLEVDKINSSTNVKDLLNSLKLCDKSQNLTYKEKYENILKEYEEFKKNCTAKESRQIDSCLMPNDETQLHRAKSHNKNLEEKLRMLVHEFSEKEREFMLKFEKQQQIIQEQQAKTEQLLSQKDSEYLNKIGILEQQLHRQRERSISVIQEKEKEIQILKSSFDALVPKKHLDPTVHQKAYYSAKVMKNVQSEGNDLVSGLLSAENNPPILYYTQELARKEVQISNLRKQNVHMEAGLRELERNTFHMSEKHEQEIKNLETQIKRLEASKSREGANLEYLKNVFINYLTTKENAKKRHMLNAISTVLRFTPDEIDKTQKVT